MNFINEIKTLMNNLKCIIREKKWKEIFRLFIFFLLALIISSTFSLSGRAGWNNFNNLFYAICIVAICVYITIYGEFIFDSFFIILICFNFFVIISSLINWKFSSENVTLALLSITVFVVYQYLINDTENLKHFLIAFVVGSLVFMLNYFIVYAKPILTFELSTRLGSYFDNENAVAYNLGSITLVFVYLSIFKKKKIMYLFSVLGVWFIITTGSLWGILISIGMILGLVFLKIPHNKRYIFWIVLFGMVVIVFALIQIPALIYFKRRIYGIINTFFGIETGSYDASSSIRLKLTKEGYLLFFRKPLFGFGPDELRQYTSITTYAHNNIAELLANYGISGFLAFEALLFFPLIKNIKEKENYSVLITLLLLHRIILQLNSVLYYSKALYFILALSFANIYNPNLKSIHLNLNLSLNDKKVFDASNDVLK